jgi:hypothetical protein
MNEENDDNDLEIVILRFQIEILNTDKRSFHTW